MFYNYKIACTVPGISLLFQACYVPRLIDSVRVDELLAVKCSHTKISAQCVCVCMYVFMYVCRYVSMYVCIYRCRYVCIFFIIFIGMLHYILFVILHAFYIEYCSDYLSTVIYKIN